VSTVMACLSKICLSGRAAGRGGPIGRQALCLDLS